MAIVSASETSGLDTVTEQKDVAGFDIAVNDSALVGLDQAAGDARHDRKRFRHVEPRLFFQQLAQARSRDELEHEIGDSVVLVVFEEIDDMGVVGLGHQAGFLVEALEHLTILRHFTAKDLDGNDSAVAPDRRHDKRFPGRLRPASRAG